MIEATPLEGGKVWQARCPMGATLDVIAGRWKGLILYHLLEDKRRFGELRRLVPEASQRILTLQLRELETDGIIHREVFKQVPSKVEYSLTPFGRTLEPILLMMCEWGDQYLSIRRSSFLEVNGAGAGTKEFMDDYLPFSANTPRK